MNQFEKYKELKKYFSFTHKGIDLNRILALQIWDLANNRSTKLNFSYKFYALVFLAIDIRKLQFNPSQHHILSTFGRYQRKDHLQLYEAVLKRLDGKASYNNTLEFGYKFSFHPLLAIRVFFAVIKSFKNTVLSFRNKCRFAVLCLHYCNIIEELENLNLNGVEKYLSMCSVLDLENLLTQYMKKKGIPTYSLQEGIYLIFKISPPIDSVLYENIETDHLLTWGKFSKDEYVSYGISSKRLHIAGYPKDVLMKRMKVMNPLKKCMILVARDSFKATNMNLLEILSKVSLNYSFWLKLHPSCDFSYYSQYAQTHHMYIISKDKTIDECLNNEEYDFSIAINTTAYYEALMRGLPCLRFYDGTFDLMAGYKDVFETMDSFLECLDVLRNIAEDEYQNEIDTVLKYAIGVGIDNYQKILCDSEEK